MLLTNSPHIVTDPGRREGTIVGMKIAPAAVVIV
jgi:uncharacterized protein (DUF433 family)